MSACLACVRAWLLTWISHQALRHQFLAFPNLCSCCSLAWWGALCPGAGGGASPDLPPLTPMNWGLWVPLRPSFPSCIKWGLDSALQGAVLTGLTGCCPEPPLRPTCARPQGSRAPAGNPTAVWSWLGTWPLAAPCPPSTASLSVPSGSPTPGLTNWPFSSSLGWPWVHSCPHIARG